MNLNATESDEEVTPPSASRQFIIDQRPTAPSKETAESHWLFESQQAVTPLPLQPDGGDVKFLMSYDELCELARHWCRLVHEHEEFSFHTAQFCGGHRRNLALSGLARISDVIGEAALRKVCEGVAYEVRMRMGPERLEIYQHGDDAAWMRVANDTHASLEYFAAKVNDESLKARTLSHLGANPAGVFVDEENDLWSLSPAWEGDRLRLFLVTSCHGSTPDNTTIERPPGWVAPTWFKGHVR